MSATIIAFPARTGAEIIPIGTAEPVRQAPPSMHEMAIDTLRNLYVAARYGQVSAVSALEMISKSHANCEIAQLARLTLDDLEQKAAGSVQPPCDCESGDVA